MHSNRAAAAAAAAVVVVMVMVVKSGDGYHQHFSTLRFILHNKEGRARLLQSSRLALIY